MTQESAARPAGVAGPTRSIEALVMTFMAGSVLLPVLQGMAGKVGEDLYGWVRRILPGKRAEAAEEQLMSDGQIALVDRARRMIFELPADLSGREAAAILNLRLPTADDAWLLVKKDYARHVWVIETVDSPPAASVDAAPDDSPTTDE
ncbi:MULTISPECIES: hypothetical protein [Streptomyces]|uniref:Uncharacterized protein n=1 Tax=Streptomyces doebereineriae TaxID=3075528 RepID=A0ABU2VIG5_9ACTN|nr:hypothetical protein [Streptomyces sp. DSM 41640]MDT0485378.1 hypothetical protein [Streptomyces sp. DSM 41640]